MGLTVLELEVGNPSRPEVPEVTEVLEFLIDSGAVYLVVPQDVLDRPGIMPLAEEQFRLADGRRIVRRKGIAMFRYGERVGGADVIFGEQGDANLLGALTLGSLGLSLDPLRRELNPLPPLPIMLATVWPTFSACSLTYVTSGNIMIHHHRGHHRKAEVA